jgi:hypothetical protein
VGSRYSKKLVRVVYIASSPRYRPMKYLFPCSVCNHPYASVATCSCVFRTAVHGSTGRIKLHSLIPRYVACWPGICPHVSVVSLFALVYEWLQQSNGCVYFGRNDRYSPCVRCSRRKWQDGSAVARGTFS